MATTEQSQQFLTFELAEETYGFEVKAIREILELQRITRVPRTADYVLGVMNVRGKVVPVMDLRLKFGLTRAEQTVENAIIVLEVTDDGAESLIGLLVDSVDEVLELAAENVEAAPKVGTTVDEQLLSGVGKVEDEFILLLNIDAVFNSDDLEIAQDSAQQGELSEQVSEETSQEQVLEEQRA